MEKKFELEINTPEKKFFGGKVEGVIVEASSGYTEILADHTPIVIGMVPSVMFVADGDKMLEIVNGEGFLLVNENSAKIFCRSAEWADEIEVNKVQREIEEYERRLNEAKSRADYKLNKAALGRLFAKLKVR